MLRDYRPNKTAKPAKATNKKKIKINHRLVFIFSLVFAALFLSVLAIKIELKNLYRLKENERVLLIKNQKPVAILFFNVNNKQLVVTDLRQNNFDLGGLEKEATLSSNLKKNLIYAFLLNTAFDQSYEYPYEDFSRANLLSFFKDRKAYRYFLGDQELLWREQKFEQEANAVNTPMFNCSVVLINTTSETGLANSLANILEKSSFSIIKKDSNTENLSQTKIIYNPEEKSCNQLLGKLNKIFPENVISANKEEANLHRSSMVIYVGRDLADLYVFFINFFHSQL